MTTDAMLLVRQSWAALEPRGAPVAARFYRQLFALDAGIRRMFEPVPLVDQAQKFMDALTTIVDSLDDPERLVPHLASLGRRHLAYGVTDRHYDLLGEALLATLRAELEPSWTPELHDAWAEAYTLIASIMKRAGARASGAVPAVIR